MSSEEYAASYEKNVHECGVDEAKIHCTKDVEDKYDLLTVQEPAQVNRSQEVPEEEATGCFDEQTQANASKHSED